MLKTLGAYNDNAFAAAREYAEQFPNCRHSDSKTIICVEQRLLQTENLKPQNNQAGHQPVLIVSEEEQIFDLVAAGPSISL